MRCTRPRGPARREETRVDGGALRPPRARALSLAAALAATLAVAVLLVPEAARAAQARGEAATLNPSSSAARPPPAPTTTYEKEMMKFLPPIYHSRPRDWGCCRLCAESDKNAPQANDRPRRVQIRDPSRFVNCCPYCPWPPNRFSRLGPFIYYYMDVAPTQAQQYERELAGWRANTHMRPPAELPPEDDTDYSDFALGDDKRAALVETGAVAGAWNSVVRALHSLAGTSAKNPQQQKPRVNAHSRVHEQAKPLDVDSDLSDPYASMRGNNMERIENYVYGFPGEAAAAVDAPPKPDLPPCCNVCNREHDSLNLNGDVTCCVHCASTLSGDASRAPWRTRREREEWETMRAQARARR